MLQIECGSHGVVAGGLVVVHSNVLVTLAVGGGMLLLSPSGSSGSSGLALLLDLADGASGDEAIAHVVKKVIPSEDPNKPAKGKKGAAVAPAPTEEEEQQQQYPQVCR